MGNIHTRNKLIDALSVAAELEHVLCCCYLYAAFSLKKSPDDTLEQADTEITRKWETSILVVARQEMEHLGMVCNLLSSIGAGPNFSRPEIPQPPNYFPINLPLNLRPFDMDALDEFIKFEAPHWPLSNDLPAEKPPLHAQLPYTSLQELYEFIKEGFNTLNEKLGPTGLFVGPPKAQITNESIFGDPTKGYQVDVHGVTDKDPAKRLAQVIAIIDQIISEGEGSIGNLEGSHYQRFLSIKEEYEAILEKKKKEKKVFQPAYDIVMNPMTYDHHNAGNGVFLTNPLTLEIARLSNLIYETMLLMLIRFYGHTDETKKELTALQEIAFFPLMTMGIRPIAEVLMQMPVSPGNSEQRAGPTFELSRNLEFLPNKNAAWAVIQEMLNQIGSDADRIAEIAITMDLPVAERLRFISLSMIRNAKNFSAYIKGKEDF